MFESTSKRDALSPLVSPKPIIPPQQTFIPAFLTL